MVTGGTGSGKTTFLNLLSQWIPPDERMLTVEDAAELRLKHAARRAPGNAPAEPRRRARGDRARPGAQRAAHAPGPHHRRRGARRRGAGHAAGDEHRPRRLDDHDARQQHARCDPSAWSCWPASPAIPAREITFRGQVASAINLLVQVVAPARPASASVMSITEVHGVKGHDLIAARAVPLRRRKPPAPATCAGGSRMSTSRPACSWCALAAGRSAPICLFLRAGEREKHDERAAAPARAGGGGDALEAAGRSLASNADSATRCCAGSATWSWRTGVRDRSADGAAHPAGGCRCWCRWR